MKVGILSDTHGNVEMTRAAAQAFKAAGVGAVFHCGDIGGFEILVELAEVFEPLAVPVHVVFGNCDHYPREWKYFPENIGITTHGRFGHVTLDGCRIAFLHSDDKAVTCEAIDSGRYDMLFTGHSHLVHDFSESGLRFINPGSAGLGSPESAAVLDLATGDLSIIDLSA